MAAVGSVFLLTGLFTPISVYFNLVMGSSVPLLPSQFPPRPSELSVTQMSASTNQTCTLTPSLIEVEGTPQQIEGPYFVDVIPNRSDIRFDTSDNSVQEGIHCILNFMFTI